MLSIDMVGNRFWLAEGVLVCAPVEADGTADMDNVSEPEALSPKAAAALTAALVALEADYPNW